MIPGSQAIWSAYKGNNERKHKKDYIHGASVVLSSPGVAQLRSSSAAVKVRGSMCPQGCLSFE
jgi:hypothetical protein